MYFLNPNKSIVVSAPYHKDENTHTYAKTQGGEKHVYT